MSSSDRTKKTWSDISEIYAQAGVSSLCLALQDEHDVDVPLLLLLVLADRDGLGCTETDFEAFLHAAAEWREQVIRPLRTIRRAMKTRFTEEAEMALRDEIKRAELGAEKRHVARLTMQIPATRGQPGSLAERYMAGRNIPMHSRNTALTVLEDAAAKISKSTGH